MTQKNKKKRRLRQQPTWLDYCSPEERAEVKQIVLERAQLSRRKRQISNRATQRMLRRHG